MTEITHSSLSYWASDQSWKSDRNSVRSSVLTHSLTLSLLLCNRYLKLFLWWPDVGLFYPSLIHASTSKKRLLNDHQFQIICKEHQTNRLENTNRVREEKTGEERKKNWWRVLEESKDWIETVKLRKRDLLRFGNSAKSRVAPRLP